MSFVHGLGGRDIFVNDVIAMYKKIKRFAEEGRSPEKTVFFGVKGEEV